jgi:hypothetical protein
MHSIRTLAPWFASRRERVAMLFGQSRDGREVIRGVDFDVDRVSWSDWPLV